MSGRTGVPSAWAAVVSACLVCLLALAGAAPVAAQEGAGTPAQSAAAGAGDAESGRQEAPAADRDDGLAGAVGQLVEVVRDPGGFLTGGLSQAFAWFFDWLTGVLRDGVATLVGLNFITSTPPALSYANPSIAGLWGVSRAIANAGLVLAAAWGALQLIVRGHIGSPYHEAMELFPRLALGALLANTSLWWARLAIDANNALCAGLAQAALPAWDNASRQDQPMVAVLATLAYLIAAVALVLQQLARLALVDVLLVLAPIGLVCWVLPQTQGWVGQWSGTFFATVFTQFVQAVSLKVGASLVGDFRPSAGPVALPDAPLLSLVLGIAVLVLTLKIPTLMRVNAGGGLGFVRYVAYRAAAGQLGGGSRTGGSSARPARGSAGSAGAAGAT
jgi:hypothetical protein